MSSNTNDYITRAQLDDVVAQVNREIRLQADARHAAIENLCRAIEQNCANVEGVKELARFVNTLANWAVAVDPGALRAAPAAPAAPQPPVVINISEGAFQSHTQVDVEPVVEAVLPARKTTTTVQRDPRGLISKTTATETDA